MPLTENLRAMTVIFPSAFLVPHAFLVVSRRLQHGNSGEMLADSNTVFCLEVFLRKFVYGKPVQLKSDARMRDAVLHLLNELVEVGSSAAYRMRDDFVTPMS